MAMHKSTGGICSSQALKLSVALMSLGLFGYILGPPLYWHLTEAVAAFRNSDPSIAAACPPCICDCSSQPLLSIPQGLGNGSFADCVKKVPSISEDVDKNFTESLLSEELKQREAEALENQRHADTALLEAKKNASQYQKEADKCNSGMETCEEAREKVEATLEEQRRLTAKWELRARQLGWKEGSSKPLAQA